MRCVLVSGILATLIGWAGATQSVSGVQYRIDAAASRIELSVYKEGILKVFGHNHLISAKDFSGTVYFVAGRVTDSSVTLSIEARSLTVLDPDTSEKDRHDVQETMAGAQVLDVARHEKITFRSTGVSRVKRPGNDWEVTLDGMLNLHGVEKPVTLPVRIHIENNRLHAEGEVYVLQTDFGMTPIRVGGGAVKVKDQVKISFSIVAEKTN